MGRMHSAIVRPGIIGVVRIPRDGVLHVGVPEILALDSKYFRTIKQRTPDNVLLNMSQKTLV